MAQKTKEAGGNTGKTVLIGALIAGGAALAARAFAKAKEEPPKEGPGAGVSITIRDAETGLPVPKNSPAVVDEGKWYIADFVVTNRSTKAGLSVAAELQVKIDGFASGTPFVFVDQDGRIWAKSWVSPFLANQTIPFSPLFAVPAGTAGRTASLTIAIWTPPLGAGVLIPGTAISEPLTIQAAIIYGATVGIAVRPLV